MPAASFDIGTAIFYFFKRFGEKPGGAIWIMICQMLVVAAVAAVVIWMMGPAIASIFELAQREEMGTLTDEEALALAFDFLQPLFGLMALSFPVGIAIALMFQGAWLRFLTRGEIAAVIPFRLGGDEIRLLGVNIIYIVLAFCVYIAIAIAAVVLSLVIGGVVSAGDGSVAVGAFGGLIGFVGFVALAAALIFIAVKLASAPALTVREKRFRFFESWGATRGVFWPMLLTYIVVAILALVISGVLSVIVQIVAMGALFPVIEQLAALDSSGGPETPEEVFAVLNDILTQPSTLIAITISFVVTYAGQMIYEGMWHGVGAYNAVRATGGTGMDDPVTLERDNPVGASPSEG